MRYSTLEEREEFYSYEFDLEGVRRWVSGRKATLFAIKIGKTTGIYKPEFKDDYRDTILLTQTPLHELRESLLYHLPESAYYDRNVYKSLDFCQDCEINFKDCFDCENFLGQELAFDLDPENIRCHNCGSLGQRIDRGEMYSFCMDCFQEVRNQSIKLLSLLKKNFSNIRIVYSGRGIHLHVFDKKAFKLSKKERKSLAQSILRKGIEHDEWVAEGSSRLIRLPYSLHGMVSRVVTPITALRLRKFDPVRECKPSFL